MNIHITPHHLALTPSLRRFAATKIEALGSIVPEIEAAHIVLLREESCMPSARFCAKVRLAVRGPDIHSSDAESSVHAAIDRVVDKLARQLRKRKTRLQNRIRFVPGTRESIIGSAQP